ncbi:hypothetical protein LJB88_03130 [Erysipelotrichaceae bacterium OttesenSCG-928-M19]|nr:hypothetical protein [Erysipelotrichaceae bacterium OttesenSCG-928-M19]
MKKIGKKIIVGVVAFFAILIVIGLIFPDTDTGINDPEKQVSKPEKKDEDKKTNNSKEKSDTINIELKVEEFSKDRLFYINCYTNLPDGTKGIISFSNKKIDYNGQYKFEVKDGFFDSDTFTQNGATLQKGTYKLEITISSTGTQPEEYKKMYGSKGEKLKTTQKDITIENGDIGKIIKYTNNVVLK